MELSGMHVVVTGGSRGIGEALAREFAARGSVVTVVARSVDALQRVASDIGGNAVVAALSDDELRALHDRCGALGLHALVEVHDEAEAARWPADDVTPPGGDDRAAYRDVTVATVLGDPAHMMSSAQAFTERYPESPQHAPVTLVVAVAREVVL